MSTASQGQRCFEPQNPTALAGGPILLRADQLTTETHRARVGSQDPISSNDQTCGDTQSLFVVAGPTSPAAAAAALPIYVPLWGTPFNGSPDQSTPDTHVLGVGVAVLNRQPAATNLGSIPRDAASLLAGPLPLADQSRTETHLSGVGEAPTPAARPKGIRYPMLARRAAGYPSTAVTADVSAIPIYGSLSRPQTIEEHTN